MRYAALVALCAGISLAAPAPACPKKHMTTSTVPAELTSKVEGCWDLAPRYRIVLRPTSAGLQVEQEAVDKRGQRVARTEPVTYIPQDQTLVFTGIGSIHRVVVKLRLVGGALESAFRTEISPGKWLEGSWEPAVRCPAS
jgi:hypothetical protein